MLATRGLKDFRFADVAGKVFLSALLPPLRSRELLPELEHEMSRSSPLPTRPRLDLVCILLHRRIMNSPRRVRDNGAGVVRHAHGCRVLGHGVGGKAPRWR